MIKYIDRIKKTTKENRINHKALAIKSIKEKIESAAERGENKLNFSIYTIDIDNQDFDVTKLHSHFKKIGFKIKQLKDDYSIHPTTVISW